MNDHNSILHDVQELYRAIYLDLTALHPSISHDLERDLTRLLSSSDHVGLKYFTIALPSACKWFDKSLSEGRLQEPRPPHCGARGKDDKRPFLVLGLMKLIFEPDGTLRSDPDTSVVASVRQVLLAAKKLRMDCEERYTHDCVQLFHEIERSLPGPWDETWASDSPRWSNRHGHPIWGNRVECDRQASLLDSPDSMLQLDTDLDWEGLRRFSARVLSELGQFSPYGIRSKHGPGAVSDRDGDFVKYDFKYWTERLESVFPYDWHASTDFTVPDYVSYREFASKMHAVPKTQSGPRLIAAEPTSHQWIQQGIRGWLEDSVRSSMLGVSINFRSQEPSRDAALEASRTGEYITVDLSSASDRLTCRLVEYLFQSRRDLLDALHACRTRATVDLYGDLLLLRKFATQGSAVIFPLQSIVYTMLAAWATSLSDPNREFLNRNEQVILALNSLHQVRVFGDDIILPRTAYPVLARLLETCLLKVNESKTHVNGFFRESCGMDAFEGTDVTPAYLRAVYSSAPDALESVVACSNNFHRKGLWHTAAHLLSTIPESERKLLPVGERIGSTGVFSYVGESLDHLKERWNGNYHLRERRALVVIAKSQLRHGRGNGPLNQFFFEEPDPDLPYQAGQVGQLRRRKATKWVS